MKGPNESASLEVLIEATLVKHEEVQIPTRERLDG